MIVCSRYISLANTLLCFLLILTSCGEKEVPVVEKNKLKLVFVHHVDGNTMIANQNVYINAAGNQYEIREVMYFISEVKLYAENGTTISIDQWDDIHYVDSNIPSSHEWIAGEDIPQGIYDSITFIFGIKSLNNKLGLFVNPPESNMAWPEILGGGYHYMMLNGFWIDNNDVRKSFNFHLGIGQIYKNNSGQTADITGFIDNSFIVRPQGQSFEVAEKGTTTLKITMNIDSWFASPHIYDHNKYGGAIMQNQEAMSIGCINGMDAFTLQQ